MISERRRRHRRTWLAKLILGSGEMPAINILIYPSFVNGIALLPGEAPIKDAFSFDFDKDPQRISKSADYPSNERSG